MVSAGKAIGSSVVTSTATRPDHGAIFRGLKTSHPLAQPTSRFLLQASLRKSTSCFNFHSLVSPNLSLAVSNSNFCFREDDKATFPGFEIMISKNRTKHIKQGDAPRILEADKDNSCVASRLKLP
jgi:hypothetical protein